MIDDKRRRIYVDFSTLSRFGDCKEQQRLGGVLGYRLPARDAKLAFGSAIHAGWEALYATEGDIDRAKIAFMRSIGFVDGVIPLTCEPGERRSVERGLALLDAYRWRWRNERFVNFATPLTEQGFLYFLTTFEGYDVFYVGYIDRIMLRLESQRPIGFEGKTTTMALQQFVRRVKPNPQITGYYRGAREVLRKIGWDGPELKEFVWDAMFLSDRAPDMGRAARGTDHRFWMYGIDVEKDFARATTTRSEADFTEFLYDAEQNAIEYCRWLTSSTTRWPRSAPRACHTYGGCQFIERCSMNFTPEDELRFMNDRYVVDRWAPWEKIVDTFEVIA